MTFREACWLASKDRLKLVSLEAFPNIPDAKKACSAFSKIFGPTPDRGDTVFDAIEAVLTYGDPEVLLALLEERLKRDPTRMLAQIDRAMGEQLGLFDEHIQTIEELQRLKKRVVEIVHLAEVLPLRRKDGGG